MKPIIVISLAGLFVIGLFMATDVLQVQKSVENVNIGSWRNSIETIFDPGDPSGPVLAGHGHGPLRGPRPECTIGGDCNQL